MQRCWIVCIWVLCAVIVLGCGINEERPSPASVPPSTDGTFAAVRPGPGQVVVEFSEGRITLYSNRAPRGFVLEELARNARFELELGAPAEALLTLDLVDIELSAALPLVVGELRYRTVWDFEPLRRTHRLRRLEVGNPLPVNVARPVASEPAPAENVQDDRDPLADRASGADSGGVRSFVTALVHTPEFAAQIVQAGEEREALLQRLEERDPQVRASAVAELGTEGEDLERLLIFAGEDPDPEVRLAAVSQLSDVESQSASAALTAALDDPSREVVLEAIDALAFADEPSTISALEPLLSHPDEAIRSAAEEALAFLEF